MTNLLRSPFMELALKEAQEAAGRGEVPVGAVLVKEKKVIASAGNEILERKDPSAHAEMLVIRQAARALSTERLIDCDLYVTLEPCPMCAAAISLARIRRLYFGASDEKTGAVENGIRFFTTASCHHRPDVYSGLLEEPCGLILRQFFEQRR